jgi:hypothetical protein
MAEQQDRPLWRVMREAYDRSSVPTDLIEACDPQTGDCLTDRYGYAAELRAIADVVAPEKQEPFLMGSSHWVQWAERQRIRAALLKAAEEAEEKK